MDDTARMKSTSEKGISQTENLFNQNNSSTVTARLEQNKTSL